MSASCCRSANDVQGAVEVLVERSQHRLVGVLVHLVGRLEEAEDPTLEVFLRTGQRGP